MRNADSPADNSSLLQMLPTWKGNLLIFSVLIIIILGYFFWQVRQAHQTFLDQVRSYSAMLGGVIELNAKGAVLSEEIVKEIMQTFLGNTARFADYLDMIQPFSPEELSAFAKEAGLAGIRIIRADGGHTEGPAGWSGSENLTCTDKDGFLQHLRSEHLYFLSRTRERLPGCVMVGLTAARIEKLHDQVGLPYLLKTLPGLAGIKSVKIDPDSGNTFSKPEIRLTENQDETVAQAQMPLGKDTLIVAMDTGYFMARVRQIRHEFFAFSAVLAFLGIFLSWLLYRYQNAYLNQIRNYERELARQREDASLGRAAAAIAHEIRNPLNAISMGLQRLQIESDELSDDSQKLVATLLKAVQRTDSIVKNIRRYAMPSAPRKQSVSMETIINHILSLYRQKYEQHKIEVICHIGYDKNIMGDPDMLEEVVENLMKNSIEAQPYGGYIAIRYERKDDDVVLSFENSGFELSAEQSEKILDPYFTTKTRGTGLGMAIADRIVQAHGGRLVLSSPDSGVIRIDVCLPL